MAYIEFLQTQTRIKGKVKPIDKNLCELVFDYPQEVNTNGFRLYNDPNGKHDIGGDSYLGFTTLYRQISDRDYILSNDGSIYVPPVFTTNFVAGGGGELIGELEQTVDDYSNLIVPTAKPDAGYKFTNWNPEIPSKGKIDHNNTFVASFDYVPHVLVNGVDFATVSYSPLSFVVSGELAEVSEIVCDATVYVEVETMQVYDNLEYVSCSEVENGILVSFRQKTDVEMLSETVTEMQFAMIDNFEEQSAINDNVEMAIAEIFEIVTESEV